jgi:guanine deaminase
VKRRRALGALLGGGVGLALAGRAEAREAAREIVQPARAEPAEFMRRAFEMRRRAEEAGDQGFGAVVVRAGRIVGEAPSAVLTRRDPTAHAEVEAIRDACRRLGTADLSGCEIYASFRPCPMCETACHWARIARMIHGADLADAGPPRYPRC